MKQIPLTQGQFALVDDEDFERVNQFKWYAHFEKGINSYYAHRGTRKIIKNKFTTIKMHRFIMNTPNDMVCDHINHNTLDNRKSNLRNCTESENMANKRKGRNNKTGIKGVHLEKGRPTVSIRKNGKRVFRKSFKTIEEAERAYKEKTKEFHGEFAYKEHPE